MQVIGDVPVFGDPVDAEALTQIQRCRATADAAALMADHHIGYAVPIGGVVVYKDAISPSGVGFDIGCGNKAVLTDMPGAEARLRIAALMDDIVDRLSFGMGQKNKRPIDSDVFDRDEWRLPEAAKLKDLARSQLGTIGSGNHYVDLFTDEQDQVWVGVHFGSRGLGHKLATHFLNAGGARQGGPEDGRGAHTRAGLPGDDARLGEAPRRGAARRRHGRGAAVLQATPGGTGAPRGHDPGAAHAPADRGGDGRGEGVRRLQGLVKSLWKHSI
jgi:RNA-splicing ligase RtcB